MRSANWTILDFLNENYRTADVFSRYGLDYYLEGGISLEQACSNAGINLEKIIKELEAASEMTSLSKRLPINTWKLSFLVDYIEHIHHTYTIIKIPELEASLEAFDSHFGEKHPKVRLVLKALKELKKQIISNNEQENEILFPYIKQIESLYLKKDPFASLFVRTLGKPILEIESGNNTLTAKIAEIQKLTNDFDCKESECALLKVIYKQLKDLYEDIIQHIDLENNFLFPKALAIESDLLG